MTARIVRIHYFLTEKEKEKPQRRFKRSQVLICLSSAGTVFVEKIFKRCHLNDDCCSLHFK